jgi:hypothetical protein
MYIQKLNTNKSENIYLKKETNKLYLNTTISIRKNKRIITYYIYVKSSISQLFDASQDSTLDQNI